MNVKEIMTRKVEVAQPTDPLEMVAQKMKIYDIGFMPVYDGTQLIGVVSDRDIVIRAMAEGQNPKAALGRDLITSPAIYCFDDQSVEDAAYLMQEHQIRRLVILSREDNHLVGVVSLSDLVGKVDHKLAGEVLQGVSEMLGML